VAFFENANLMVDDSGFLRDFYNFEDCAVIFMYRRLMKIQTGVLSK